jgi:hypothetical protein
VHESDESIKTVTFYEPTGMGGIGACGFPISDEDFVVAIAHEFFDSFP